MVPTNCMHPVGIYATATDNDHFSGSFGGFWDPLGSPCHYTGEHPISGERIGLTIPIPTATLSTPTPTLPLPSPTAVRAQAGAGADRQRS
jgi:hypothetical protein